MIGMAQEQNKLAWNNPAAHGESIRAATKVVT